MGTGLVPSVGERVERSAPAWVGVTEWHICDGSRPRADMLLIRPTGGPGRCRRPRRTGQIKGTPKRPERWYELNTTHNCVVPHASPVATFGTSALWPGGLHDDSKCPD